MQDKDFGHTNRPDDNADGGVEMSVQYSISNGLFEVVYFGIQIFSCIIVRSCPDFVQWNDIFVWHVRKSLPISTDMYVSYNTIMLNYRSCTS